MFKLCLFSAVKGVVLDQGKPVEGAVIERSYEWAWNDRNGVDRTMTNDKGEFALPAIWGRSLFAALLPHEPLVDQIILIHHAGRVYKGWMLTRSNYREDGELAGRPIALKCCLEAEPAYRGKVCGMGSLQ